MLSLNERAWQRCDELAADAEQLKIAVLHSDSGTRVIDCGVKAVGSLEAGRQLAEICLADCGCVGTAHYNEEDWSGPIVCVTTETEQPWLACLASQYAGWQITGDKYFAMGSGPMRAAACREPLFAKLDYRERPDRVVGVLETGKLPPDEVCTDIASKCGVSPASLTLLVARTASIAGTVQIVARSVETALHKLHEVGYDVKKVQSGMGAAPLPPVAADDMTAIGRTNDAVLYGGEVTLQVCDKDAKLQEIGPKIPSSSSPDFGEPFLSIFKRYGGEFYKIDPLLFSPAVVRLVNAETGRTHSFGEARLDVWQRSFES